MISKLYMNGSKEYNISALNKIYLNGMGDYNEIYEDAFIKGYYRFGKKERKWIESDGGNCCTSNYKNGLLDGKYTIANFCKPFVDAGSGNQIFYDTSFINGTGYFKSIDLLQEGNLIMGSKNGKWKFYYNSGQVQCEGEYANNKKNGQWTYYDKKNIPTFIMKYENGFLLKYEKTTTGN